MTIRYHTRPTQIDRKDPYHRIHDRYRDQWIYEINDKYFVSFVTLDLGVGPKEGECALCSYDDRVAHATVNKMFTKNDLVTYVKHFRGLPENQLEDFF